MSRAVRRILVTGASTPLGRAALARLGATSGVEHVVGHDMADTGAESGPAAGRWSSDHGALARVLRDEQIDTVLHCGLAPDRTGIVIQRQVQEVRTN